MSPGAPVDQSPPSYEMLAALVVSLRGELAQARAELARARERIAELEAQLRQTPQNSSRPPSGEGLGKPPPARGLCGRSPGASRAGRTGTRAGRWPRWYGRPGIERECPCGRRAKPTAPQGAQAPVQYGPRIAAIIVYLYTGQFLSKQRTAQTLAELFGVPLSPGTVAAITARAAGKLDGFLERAREQIAASAVAGFDETGFRVEGKLAWAHCARTGNTPCS